MTTTLADVPWQRAQCDRIRAERHAIRRAAPLVRFWTNNPDSSPGLLLRGSCRDSVAGKTPFRRNQFGSAGTIRLRLDHYISRWLISIPNDPTAMKNVVLTVDYAGGNKRWSGLLKNWKVVRSAAGIRYLEATFIDDLQFLQYMLGPPNPVLPIPIFQFPRVLPIFGPAKWAISIMIWLQLLRLEGNIWTPPDDPFAAPGGDMSTWQVLIKAKAFDLDDSSLWTILATRMTRMDQVIADSLEDAQLVMTYRRILTVDGEVCPIEGVSCANGTLVLEVVDKSGYWNADGTGTGGGIAGGFERTIQSFLAGFVEDTSTAVSGGTQTIWPNEYYDTSYNGTAPGYPWVVVRDSDWTQMQTSQLVWGPATAARVIVGGDNPMVDQLAKLAIEATGALIGYFMLAGFSDLGSIASDIAMPFLTGTIAAFLEWQNHTRASQLGWAHLHELFQQGAENNAWSLSAIAALRAGFLASRSETAHQFTMGLGGPFIPGLDFEEGDRIGSTVAYVSDYIFVDQVEEMTPSWDWESGKDLDWAVTVGKAKAALSQAERSANLLNKALQTMSNIGLHLIS